MAEPFLRWAGGKRWLAKTLAPLLSERLGSGTYFEPFLGSGSMYFALQPARAVLSDINRELINAFKQVAVNAAKLKAELALLGSGKAEYERIRQWRPRSDLERAVRFVFLNRNCWGGLYRENKGGVFNVPYGGGSRSHRCLVEGNILEDAKAAITRGMVELLDADFGEVMERAAEGDVVYCDPTYRRRARQHFDRYGSTIFGWEDQKRLAEASKIAESRGALVIVSNASCFGVKELYEGGLVLEVSRRKGLGGKGASAALVEYLFVLDPQGRWDDWKEVGTIVYRPFRASRRTCRRTA